MTALKPSAGMQKLLAFLGEPYSARLLDLENVIYRDLGNGYDIEVSGVDISRKAMNARVYVWRRVSAVEIVEIYEGIINSLDLKDLLGAISLKYRNSDPEKPLYVKSR